ncbi:hypothetical protein V1478_009247 [Vespula squamosa]|uniref:Uncharacterized protein n=1 Tax=Vespula squamosa TaxID=30214 RepID=A0ABD2AP33_VESSQ
MQVFQFYIKSCRFLIRINIIIRIIRLIRLIRIVRIRL